MRSIVGYRWFIFLFFFFLVEHSAGIARADEDLGPVDLGEEYPDYARTTPGGSAGPGSEESFAVKALLYLPNRLLDVLDIFRADVGVGPANGAVLRITDYGQIGARYFSPGSVRLGLFGRDWPARYEDSDEFGIGPGFVRSRDRQTGKFELGAGGDLLIAGAYVGVRFDEIFDFLAGVIGFDPLDDDLS